MAQEVTIRFIRNYTAEPLGNALSDVAQKAGLQIKTEFGAYDNLGAEIATLASSPSPPEFAVVTIDLEYFSGGLSSPKWDFGGVKSGFESLLHAIDAVP